VPDLHGKSERFRLVLDLTDFGVNQELTRVCCGCRRTEYNFIYVPELEFSREKSQREVLANREPNDH